MNFKDLKKINLKNENNIKTEFYLKNSVINHNSYDIILIKFIGNYRNGSKGNLDAKFLCANIEFAKEYFKPNGIILDLTELKYEWGDELEKAFGAGKYIAFAVLISDLNKKAIGTLVNFGNENIPATDKEYIYDSFNTAWKYLTLKIPELMEQSEKDFEKLIK
jgi:hypothetical protein